MKVSRPKTLAEAKKLIAKTFKTQPFGGWCEDEQARYFKMIGVAGTETESDVRAIFRDLENSKMILLEG